MSWQRPDSSYWNEKFAAWWHDPIDKVLAIPGHEERAAVYLEIFGLQKPNEDAWKKADSIAAGFERGQVPTYHSDERKSGAVDFRSNPLLSHPTSGKAGLLKIEGALPPIDEVHAAVLDFLKKMIGTNVQRGDYAFCFQGDEQRFAYARILYSLLVLRFALSEADVAGLGALWHRLPADSRFPDHSIWQHNALCSAIHSCIDLGGSVDDVGLMVYSITPVQGFIARARKTRDFWAGSVLLSWLSFAGIRWVMENLGPDHVLYPSLIDQPLVNAWLREEWKITGTFQPRLWKGQSRGIANLPNKFLFLIPIGKAQPIAAELEISVVESWRELVEITAEDLIERLGLLSEDQAYLRNMFERQNATFWNCQWAATRLAVEEDEPSLKSLLGEELWERQKKQLENVKPIVKQKGYDLKEAGRAAFYSTSHELIQKTLAAEKMRRAVNREPEPGEKCQMCGEFEVLHATPGREGESTQAYEDSLRSFWKKLEQEQEGDVDIKKNERLCSVCAVKRFLPGILRREGNHLLATVFRADDSFPSTTEMALDNYFLRRGIDDRKKRKDIAQKLHEDEEFVKGEMIKHADKYYAILLMDGDRMGRLINGDSIAATWKMIMHPDLVKRIERPDFDPLYRKAWLRIYGSEMLGKRLVTPAIHASISEALGDFSVYGVPKIISKHRGRLIYAGGDDVCAFLPIGTSLIAACEISNYYNSVFRLISSERGSQPLAGTWRPEPGKLSVNLGEGNEISISAAILICHHKESLAQMVERAHELLTSEAKDNARRNACAVELRKRHGGSRVCARQWSDKAFWDSLSILMALSGEIERVVSHSLLYRLEILRPALEAIIFSGEQCMNCIEGRLHAFLLKQLEHSGTCGDIDKELVAKAISGVIWDKHDRERPIKTDGLLIAGFLGREVEG